MKISIVVPAFNEEKLIVQTLRKIRTASEAFSELGWSVELIVCDNNSTDRTSELARAEEATVVFEPINQIARARNTGARTATGEWLIFVDADSHPSRALMADVAAEIQRGGVLGGGVTLQLNQASLTSQFLCGAWNLLSRCRNWMAGSFIFCHAAAFREIGGFNEEFYASEELDLSNRLREHAKSTRQKIVILSRHPLITSGRKTALYSPWEHVRFLLKMVVSRGRTLRDREACLMWYDGRR